MKGRIEPTRLKNLTGPKYTLPDHVCPRLQRQDIISCYDTVLRLWGNGKGGGGGFSC